MAGLTDIAIIYNPNSTGNAERNAVALRRKLQVILPALPIKLLPTQHAGHAVELAHDFAKAHKRPLIVSASGDGGYNEVINGAVQAQLDGARPVCAVLPSGNANDHARTMQRGELVELIQRGAVTRLDLLKVVVRAPDGTVLSRYAHSYVGVGLTPTVAVELNKHTLNTLKEAWIILKTFRRHRPVALVAGKRRLSVDSLICSIIPEMAKVLTISKEAHPQDGKFELTVFEHKLRLTLLYRLLRGVMFQMGTQQQLERYSFTLTNPAPIQLDGEILKLAGGSKVTIESCPDLLTTIV